MLGTQPLQMDCQCTNLVAVPERNLQHTQRIERTQRIEMVLLLSHGAPTLQHHHADGCPACGQRLLPAQGEALCGLCRCCTRPTV